MPSQALLDHTRVRCSPGDEVVLELTVRNIGFTTEGYTVVADGPARDWVLIDPPTVSLEPSATQELLVLLRLPRHWSTTEGVVPLLLRVVSHDDPGAVTLAEATITVLPVDHHRLAFAAPVQRGRRRAEFPVVLQSEGNRWAAFRLQVVDPSGQLRGTVDPPSLGVGPGGTQAAVVRVTGRRRRWRRRARPLPFELHAVSSGLAPVVAHATLLQEPVVPARSLGRLAIGGLLVAGIAAGWLGVVRPAIDNAAADAWSASRPLTPTSTAAAAPTVQAADAPAPFDRRVEVTATLGNQQVGAVEVPPGTRLRITDAQFQNPDGAQGRLSVLRDATVLYTAGMANFPFLTDTLVSPWVFEAGQRLIVQMDCTGTQSSSGSCTAAVTFTGTVAGS